MIGNRLKLAREALGLSLRDLEAAIAKSTSAQAIGKYERNEMMPSSAVLETLAQSLQTSPEYLLNSRKLQLSSVTFRKTLPFGAKESRMVESQVLEYLERYVGIEELLPHSKLNWEPPNATQFKVETIDDAELAANSLRELWAVGIHPVLYFGDLVEEKGIRIVPIELPDDFPGCSANIEGSTLNFPVVVVNKTHPGEYQRFTLAKELGSLVLEYEGKAYEDIIDRFASSFLLNATAVTNMVGKSRACMSLGELIELKVTFGVPLKRLLERFNQLDITSKSVHNAILADLKSKNWNSQPRNEPKPLAPLEFQRMQRLALRAVSEGALVKDQAAHLLGIETEQLENYLNGY